MSSVCGGLWWPGLGLLLKAFLGLYISILIDRRLSRMMSVKYALFVFGAVLAASRGGTIEREREMGFVRWLGLGLDWTGLASLVWDVLHVVTW